MFFYLQYKPCWMHVEKLLKGLQSHKKIKRINHTNETRATVDRIFNVILKQTWISQTVDFIHHFDTRSLPAMWIFLFLMPFALNINLRWEFSSYLDEKCHKSNFASNYLLNNLLYCQEDATTRFERKEAIYEIRFLSS